MDNATQNTQNVISMTDHQPETGFAAIAQVEAYWEALRGDRLMPSRAEIDPRGIEQALEFSFIVERIAPGIARMRIAGNHLCDLLGMEVRGMPLTSMFVADARRQLADALEEVFERPAVGTFSLTSAKEFGRPELKGRMKLMPLKSDLGDVSRILGCMVVHGDLGKGPRRLEISHQQVSPIHSGEGSVDIAPTRPVVPDAARPHMPPAAESADSTQYGFSDGAETFTARPKKPVPPYLRLVKPDE